MKRHLLCLAISTAGVMAPSAKASVCSDANNCTFTFDVHNVGPTTFGSGPYGTLSLVLNGDNTITATIDLADGFGLINTGFPNGPGTAYGFAFNDNLADATFSYSAFTSGYSGGTANQGTFQFDGFGDFDRAAANTSLGNTAGANVVSLQSLGPEGSIVYRTSSASLAVTSTLLPTFFTTEQIIREPDARRPQVVRA